jgi:hypothetical protein
MNQPMTEREEDLTDIERELDELQAEFDRLMDGMAYGPELEADFGPPPWKLNLGCGMERLQDYIDIDCEEKAEPDLVCDLEEPWPFPSDSVSEILAKHVVEHLHDLKALFQEAYRVMQDGAEMVITVPHQCSDFFWGDPTHVRPITKMMMDLLSKKACAFALENKFSNTPLAIYWNIDFEVYEQQFALHDEWQDKFDSVDKTLRAIATYNNIASEVQFKLRCVKGEDSVC